MANGGGCKKLGPIESKMNPALRACLLSFALVVPTAWSLLAAPRPNGAPGPKGAAKAKPAKPEGVAAGVTGRERFWNRRFDSRAAYEASIQPNRERLRKFIGAVDEPLAPPASLVDPERPAAIGKGVKYEVFAVRWPVFEGVFGEGLLLKPRGEVSARAVLFPDAGQTPEMLGGLAPGLERESQAARRLAESGVEVVALSLLDWGRPDGFSPSLPGSPAPARRDWVCAEARDAGRHVIGYETQAGLAALKWAGRQSAGASRAVPVGVAGYGEGGLLALFCAALDPGVAVALASGYFGPRDYGAEEPASRRVAGMAAEFGDAEIASLVAPRPLLVEYSPAPRVGSRALPMPERYRIEEELNRAFDFFPNSFAVTMDFIDGNEGRFIGPFSPMALEAFGRKLGIAGRFLENDGGEAPEALVAPETAARQARQEAGWLEFGRLARCRAHAAESGPAEQGLRNPAAAPPE